MAHLPDPPPVRNVGAGQLSVNLTLVAPASAAGERLDRWLSTQFPALGRSLVAQQIGDGAVTVNGSPVKPGLRLKGGERIEGTLTEPPRASAPRAEAIPLP